MAAGGLPAEGLPMNAKERSAPRSGAWTWTEVGRPSVKELLYALVGWVGGRPLGDRRVCQLRGLHAR